MPRRLTLVNMIEDTPAHGRWMAGRNGAGSAGSIPRVADGGRVTETPEGLILDPIPAHPLLAGCREIGRGENTIVVEAGVVEGRARVYKLLTSPTDYAYCTAPDRPVGPHFPVVFADHGIAGPSSRGYPFHIVEVERLYPLPSDGEASELAARITTAYFAACGMWRRLAQDMGRIALYHLVVTPFGWSGAMRDALDSLSTFTREYGALPDLVKADNLMMRPDGTLVFSDPVFMP